MAYSLEQFNSYPSSDADEYARAIRGAGAGADKSADEYGAGAGAI